MQSVVGWTAMFLTASAAVAASEVAPAMTLEMKRAARSVPIELPTGALAGGEDFATATVIPSLPFQDGGNTCGAVDDLTPTCAFADESTAPDHVYRFSPTSNMCVDISLCGSGYDTILHVYENNASTLAGCNDDLCGLQSRLTLTLAAGNDYYIVVDGWASACGGYVLNVEPLDATVSGTVFYYWPAALPNSNPVVDVQVCVDPPAPSACAYSTPSGAFKVTGLGPANASVTAYRDRTSTDPSAVGGGDINLLVQALAASVTLEPGQRIAADVNRSGGPPNVSDLQAMRRYAVFDFAACPDCATWRVMCDSVGLLRDGPRPLSIPWCENTSIDFRAIFLGDVDGSWPGRFALRSDPRPIPLAFGTPGWNNGEVTVDLYATIDATSLESLLFSLDYDADALELVAASTGEAAQHFDLTTNAAEPGLLHGILSGSRVTASGPILVLRFRSRNDQPGRLSFSRLLANDVPVAALAPLELDPESAALLSTRHRWTVAPNPFNPTLWIDYAIPAASGPVPVVLQVHDLSGRLVRRLFDGERDPGPYRAVWDGRGDDGRALASGVYLLHIRAGTWQSSRKTVLLR